MSDVALEFNDVWKKFKRGEKFHSLRDLIPAMTKRLFLGNHRGELEEQEFWALQGVSFQVRRGEALGVIGPNGAGKSTILKLLSGIMRPNKGEIKVNGRLSALIEVGAGFHPDLTGRENIYLNGAILGMKKSEIDKKFDEIVEFSGVQEFIDTPVKQYSSGMYARLGFSVAAHVNPDILLVDEVLSVGDLQFQEKCINKMLSLKEEGIPIVFVSHNLQSIQLLCKRAILLRIGKISKEGSVETVLSEYLFPKGITTDSLSECSITDVTCLNSLGEKSNVFKAGERVILKFNIRANRPLNEYLLGFLIRKSTDGSLLCSYDLPLSLLKDEGNTTNSFLEKSAILEFQLNLLRGLYTITLHLYHSPSKRHVFWADNIISLTSEERISWEGVSYLKPRLYGVGGPTKDFLQKSLAPYHNP
jgi:lipopolysaccharide transport system ATP-binding protein